MSLIRNLLLMPGLVIGSLLSIGSAPAVSRVVNAPQQQTKQPSEVVEAYRICRTFEQSMAQNLDFAKAFEATFAVSKARRRAIAIAEGEFGNLDYPKISDDQLIRAYKARTQIFYLMLVLARPEEDEEKVFFPPEIKEIIDRKPPGDSSKFGDYAKQLEQDAVRFRAHIDGLAARDRTVADRLNEFRKSFSAQMMPPAKQKVAPIKSSLAAGILLPGQAYYQINGYLVARDQARMRIIGLRFFTRLI